MKKLCLFTIATMFCVVSMNAQGENSNSVRFGASLGVNFGGVTGDDVNDAKSRTGFRGGAVVDIPVSDDFSIQPTAAIVISGWKEFDIDIKANYVVVEAKADYEVVDGLSLQAGPFVGFNIHASFDGNDIDNFESTNFGVLGAVQYELPIGLFFNAQYDMGFTDLADNFDANLCNFSVSIGKFF